MDSDERLRRLELVKELISGIRAPASQSASPEAYPKLYERYLKTIENVVGVHGVGLLHFDDSGNNLGGTSDRSSSSTVLANQTTGRTKRLSLAHIVKTSNLPSPNTPTGFKSPLFEQPRHQKCAHGYPPGFACGYCDGGADVDVDNSWPVTS